jgi:30S ribosomal protein S31
MGKGDKKTRRGKIFKGSFGNSRPKSHTKAYAPATTAKKAAAPKKAAAKK